MTGLGIVAGTGLAVWLVFGRRARGAPRRVTPKGGTVLDPQTRVGRFFKLYEFTRSTAASDLGLSNEPNEQQLTAIRALCASVLDPLRASLNRSVSITSGFRSLAVNDELRRRGKNASTTSQHLKGEAADIKVEGMKARDLARAIVALGVPFDQVIWYAPERGGHVHVSFTRTGRNRRQVLHAPATGGYVASQV